MKEHEMAERLTSAIEDLLQGSRPGDLDDQVLNQLLEIAEIRLDAARSSARAAAQHEGDVWRQVLTRVGQHQSDTAGSLADAANDPAGFDIKELQDIIGLRRQMAQEAASSAQAHQDTVWHQVHTRIQSRSREGGLPFFRRRNPEADALATALDRVVLGESIWEASDSKLEEMIRLARSRRAMGQAATLAARDLQGRLWARIRPRLLARLLGSRQPRSTRVFLRPGLAWPKLAAAGAAVALVLAAVGPIPATGLAGHPVAQFIQQLAGHQGVSETRSGPTVPPVTQVVDGADVTAEQAAELLGLPVREPNGLPVGFQQVSSKFFSKPLTASEGGLFLQSYSPPAEADTPNPPTLLIYQEPASGSDIAVEAGFALDLRLADGTLATYIEGTWQPSGGDQTTWNPEGGQTLVFEDEDLLTIITYTDGPWIDPRELLAIANGLAVP